jgi:D-alanyl-D-alanine carboxypeptidase
MIAENATLSDQRAKPQAFALASAPASRTDAGATSAIPSAPAAQGVSDPIKPILVKTIPVRAGTTRTAALASVPPQAATLQPADTSKPQIVTTRPDPDPQPPIINPQPGVLGVLPASVAAQPVAVQPSIAQQTIGPPPAAVLQGNNRQTLPPTASAEAVAREFAQVTPAKAEPAPQPAQVHTGWIIQVGALEGESEAKARLDLAQSKAHDALGRAEAFTETFVKGDKTYYRARFAGFDKDHAEAACKSLKRNEIPCMALKN